MDTEERGKYVLLTGIPKRILKAFTSFYKIVGIVVLGAIAIFALSQSAGLSVLVCIAIGWYLHKHYDLKIKKRPKKRNEKKP